MKLDILEDVPFLRNVHSRYGTTENIFLRGKTLLQNKSLWRHRFDPWVGKIPWSRKWQHAPVFLPEKSHGQRSLAGYSPWVAKSWTQLSTQTLMLSPQTGASLRPDLQDPGLFFTLSSLKHRRQALASSPQDYASDV